MTTTTCLSKTTSFFELLEQTPGLDMRDNRGKIHSISLVISGLVMALCCGRDGKLSSLHRNMVNHFSALCKATNSSQPKPISRSQLPILLSKVNGTVFSKLLLDWFNIELNTEQKAWFSCDGKELCGSIQPGKQRGEACVSVMSHDSERIIGQTYYQGMKESERPATYLLLNDLGLFNQKLTLDALHLNPLLINAIDAAGGTYLIGLKANQYHLYRHCICLEVCQSAEFSRDDAPERGHGRLEQRSYQCFKINRSNLATRWHVGGPQSLLVVNRQRQSLDGERITNEKSYYASNAIPECQADADELFNAVRQHWCVESMHYQRDVTLSEDDFRTKNGSVSRLMSSLRTLIINLLKGYNGTGSKIKNMAAQLDNFVDNIQTLIQFLTKELIL